MATKKTTPKKTKTAKAATPKAGKVVTAKAATPKPAEAKAPDPALVATGDAIPKLSLIKAAIKILEEREEAMNCRELVQAAKDKELWTPGVGKTPEQTLYSALTREIKRKGEAARVELAGHGKFRIRA